VKGLGFHDAAFRGLLTVDQQEDFENQRFENPSAQHSHSCGVVYMTMIFQ
jgi:hypothetical protein